MTFDPIVNGALAFLAVLPKNRTLTPSPINERQRMIKAAIIVSIIVFIPITVFMKHTLPRFLKDFLRIP